jgi:hypothetical protein
MHIEGNPENLFKGGDWQTKISASIKKNLDQFLWKWMEKSEKMQTIRSGFNAMVAENMDKFRVMVHEGVSIQKVIIPLMNAIKTKHLLPLIKMIENPELKAEKALLQEFVKGNIESHNE